MFLVCYLPIGNLTASKAHAYIKYTRDVLSRIEGVDFIILACHARKKIKLEALHPTEKIDNKIIRRMEKYMMNWNHK